MSKVAALGPTAEDLRPCKEHKETSSNQSRDRLSIVLEPSNHNTPVARALTASGVIYVATTLFASYNFLFTARAVLANDFFWADFNATFDGFFVATAFNNVLGGIHNETKVSLTDPQFQFVSSLPLSSRLVTVSAHYARLVQYHRLTRVEDGISGLRHVPASRALEVFTQYCWVDFDRRWSLAHTEKRAERCLRDHRDNAAVYLESMLRNVDWGDFLAASKSIFQIAIQDALLESNDGAYFLNTVKVNKSTSVSDEAAYWRSKGLTHYTLQYHNVWQLGIDEKISIVNAFGLAKNVTIKHIDYISRWNSQTTFKMYWAAANDFWAVVDGNTIISGLSLVRNASNFFGKKNITMEQVAINDGGIPFPFSPQDARLRELLGPFNSIDMIWTMYPPELFQLLQKVRTVVFEATTSSDAARSAYYWINTGILMTATPGFWSDQEWRFAGGSPLCGHIAIVPYITHGMQFDETCGQTVQEAWTLDQFSFVFSYLAAPVFQTTMNLTTVCRYGTTDIDECVDSFTKARQFSLEWINETTRQDISAAADLARQSIQSINVSLMQYVIRASAANLDEVELLVEPLLPKEAATSWEAFAWLYLLDWATGLREVVSFQGDHNTLTLMSTFTVLGNMPQNEAEITVSLSTSLLLGVQYVTAVLCLVAVAVLGYAASSRFQVAGVNLLEFNRICGVVWIGRPLLALRGVVAICILSTSRVHLLTSDHFSWMDEGGHRWYNAIITAGEVTWVLCVAIDLLLVVIRGSAFYIAPITHTVVWIAVASLQLLSPVEHTMIVHPQCQFAVLESNILCHGGQIQVGSFSRFTTLLLISAISLASVCVLVRMCCTRDRMREDGIVLPGMAQEMFAREDWVYRDRWFLDRASAMMAGLITFRRGRTLTVIDFKSWSVLHKKMDDTILPQENATHLRRAVCLTLLRAKSNTD